MPGAWLLAEYAPTANGVRFRDAALGYTRSEQKVLSPLVKTLWWGNAHAEQPSPPRRLFPFASSITPCPA